MSLGGGGGGGGTASRKEIVKAEREMLAEVERRMVTYETLFGDIERRMISESMGILNEDLIRPMNDEVIRVSEMATDADARLKKLRAQRDEIKKEDGGFGPIGGVAGKALSKATDNITYKYVKDNLLPKIPGLESFGPADEKKYGKNIVDRGDGWVEELMPRGGDFKRSKKQREKINAEINEILNAQRKLKDLMEDRTSAIQTQQRNSKLEQTEQARERTSGVIESAFRQTGATRQIRDEGYGIDPAADSRASAEQAKETALLRAAAEAGARNKAKTDVDTLAQAKLGAIAGADLTDRAAATQLQNLNQSFLSQSAAYADQAAAFGQQKNQATLAAIQGMGQAAGAVVGTGYGVSTRTPAAPATYTPQVVNPSTQWMK